MVRRAKCDRSEPFGRRVSRKRMPGDRPLRAAVSAALVLALAAGCNRPGQPVARIDDAVVTASGNRPDPKLARRCEAVAAALREGRPIDPDDAKALGLTSNTGARVTPPELVVPLDDLH